MTCIVGLVENEKIYMGGDSAGVGDIDLEIRANKKVFKKDSFIIGFTSSFRMGQLLQYNLRIPTRYTDIDILEYMVNNFIDAIRNCLKEGGFAKKDKDTEEGGTFLVGYKNRLFKIEDDYQVGENILPFNACGCGASYAKGSLYSTKGPPEKRLLKALYTAQEFCAGVREPFYVERLGD